MSGLPYKKDLVKYKGQSLVEHFYLKDEFRNPLDLTGFTAKMQVRESVNDGDEETNAKEPILEFTTENGGITINPDIGSITIYKDRLTKPMVAVYDLFIFDSNGTSTLIISPKSKFKVLESVTNV